MQMMTNALLPHMTAMLRLPARTCLVAGYACVTLDLGEVDKSAQVQSERH